VKWTSPSLQDRATTFFSYTDVVGPDIYDHRYRRLFHGSFCCQRYHPCRGGNGSWHRVTQGFHSTDEFSVNTVRPRLFCSNSIGGAFKSRVNSWVQIIYSKNSRLIMFQQMKNIASAFRYVEGVRIALVMDVFVTAVSALYKSFSTFLEYKRKSNPRQRPKHSKQRG